MPYDFAIHTVAFDHQFSDTVTKPPRIFLFYKRSFDIVMSLMLAPTLIIICITAYALNIFLNPGPLFFTQERVGINKQVFQIYKLRSMQEAYEDGSAKVTPLGQFMRDIHIDELPQIINVLLGDMSLIGPRPERPHIYKNYAKSIQNFASRQSVRPGISGLAQLCCGYTDCHAGARKKLKWDLEYIRHQGFGMDSRIYIQTFAYVFPRIGKRLIALAIQNRKS